MYMKHPIHGMICAGSDHVSSSLHPFLQRTEEMHLPTELWQDLPKGLGYTCTRGQGDFLRCIRKMLEYHFL